MACTRAACSLTLLACRQPQVPVCTNSSVTTMASRHQTTMRRGRARRVVRVRGLGGGAEEGDEGSGAGTNGAGADGAETGMAAAFGATLSILKRWPHLRQYLLGLSCAMPQLVHIPMAVCSLAGKFRGHQSSE